MYVVIKKSKKLQTYKKNNKNILFLENICLTNINNLKKYFQKR